jgi:hypothetical protein
MISISILHNHIFYVSLKVWVKTVVQIIVTKYSFNAVSTVQMKANIVVLTDHWLFWVFLGHNATSSAKVQICSTARHIFIVMHAITIAAVQQCNYTQISKTSTV